MTFLILLLTFPNYIIIIIIVVNIFKIYLIKRKDVLILTTNNMDIKIRAKQNGVYLWEIANELGIIDSNFSRKLRKELPTAEKEAIFKIIDDIADKKENAVD